MTMAEEQADRPLEPSRCEHCDVLVIGGGPGGSAAATFLAREGLKVVLIERDTHPRFHIGESLLPGSLPILEALGVLDRVSEIGVYKPGAEFVSSDGTKEAVFSFNRALLGGPGHAFQVRRDEFDALLFDQARAAGAMVMEGTEARVAALSPDGSEVATRAADGAETSWRANYLIDASGRSTVVSKLLNQKRPDPRNTSAAIFGHFHGIARKQGPEGGNIRIHLTEPGWVWQIPLRNDVTSIGLVAPGAYMRDRNTGIEAFFLDHMARHPLLARVIGAAEPVSALQATGNFSYSSTAATSTSHIKVGDAYGFLDPVFSTGVHLALCSAREAASAVMASLAKPATRKLQLAEYDRRIKRRLAFVSWFIYKINDRGFRHLMLNPQNFLGVEQAVISLLAGDFRADPRLRARIALFKAIRYFSGLRGRSREIAYAG